MDACLLMITENSESFFWKILSIFQKESKNFKKLQKYLNVGFLAFMSVSIVFSVRTELLNRKRG